MDYLVQNRARKQRITWQVGFFSFGNENDANASSSSLSVTARVVGRPEIEVRRQRHDEYQGPPADNLTMRGLGLPIESLLPIHQAQLMSYLKSTKLQLGLLINFNVPILKQGIRRVILSPSMPS